MPLSFTLGRAGRWRFAPRRVPTLATLLLLPCLLGLGLWQLQRAEEKARLDGQYLARQSQAPVTALPIGADPAQALRYRRAELWGRFDDRHSLLLDNRTHQGRAGYHIYTPLRLEQGGAVLVNRGWVPILDRAVLPAIAPRQDLQQVRGLLDLPANPGLRLGDDEPLGQAWPQRLQRLDPARVAAAIGYPLSGLVLLEQDSGEPGYVRDWRPAAALGADRHRGYAVQWFTLALSLAVIFLVTNLRRRDPAR